MVMADGSDRTAVNTSSRWARDATTRHIAEYRATSMPVRCVVCFAAAAVRWVVLRRRR